MLGPRRHQKRHLVRSSLFIFSSSVVYMAHIRALEPDERSFGTRIPLLFRGLVSAESRRLGPDITICRCSDVMGLVPSIES